MSDWTPAATDMLTTLWADGKSAGAIRSRSVRSSPDMSPIAPLKRASAAMTIYDEIGRDGVKRWSFYVGRSDAPIMWAGPYLSESDVLEAALLWQRGRP